MNVKCNNPECGHEWDYKGKSKWYATCGICRKIVRIRELMK